jgi:hypothetical protein
MKILQVLIACFLFICNNVNASENVKINHYTNLQENNILEVLFEFNIDPDWHIFAPYEQEFGSPLKIEWQNVNKNDIKQICLKAYMMTYPETRAK